MRYVPRLDVVDTPVGRGRPPTLRRSLLDARGRSPGCRSRKRLGTLERAPLLLKSSIITSSPPLAGILSALVLRRSAGRVRGSLGYGRSRSSLLLSCVGLARATGAALLRGDRSPCFVRLHGSNHTGFCAPAAQPDGLRLPGDPPIQQSGLAGSSTTRGGSPQAWHGLAGCPEASRLLFLPFASIPLPPVPFLLSCNRRPPRGHESDL